MKKLESITGRDRQLPFTVPAGYFDSLRERVLARCGEPFAEKKHLTLWSAIRPQLALAAGFALLVGIATLAAQFAAAPARSNANEVAATSYISALDIQAYGDERSETERSVSVDAIVDYLLRCGSIDDLTVIN